MNYRVYEARDGSHFSGRSTPDAGEAFRIRCLLLLPFTVISIGMAAVTLVFCGLIDRWRGRGQ